MMQSIFNMWEETVIPDAGGTFQPAFTPGAGIPNHRPGIPINQGPEHIILTRFEHDHL